MAVHRWLLRQGSPGQHWGCHGRRISHWQKSCRQYEQDPFGHGCLRLPIAFRITGGEVHDSTEAQALIDDLLAGDALVADKGYDSVRFREQVEAKGMDAVIPRKRNSKKGNTNLDRRLYRYRHWSRMPLPD